jgi:BirA family transcriptional regulator, biotin operon repressor / biotin---[acetyl-CoA-carboxylase] ligase
MLSSGALREALGAPGGFWHDIRVVAETGSTNADLLAEAKTGLPEGAVLAADSQSAGRGRLGRRWVSPPGTSLSFSVLLRPAAVPAAARAWVPLLAGISVAAAVRGQAAVDARLKWPNDVLVRGAKLAGILAEQAGDAIVVGIGINVSVGRDDLPVAGATSLGLEGAVSTGREGLLAAALGQIAHWYLAWKDEAGDADRCGLREEYLRRCATVGQQVRVSLPGGTTVTGEAVDVDRAGRLVVRSAAGLISVSAGDVVHVR